MISNPAQPHDHPISSSPLLFIAWLVVLLPLAWGVYNTVKTSTQLFTTQNTPATGAAH